MHANFQRLRIHSFLLLSGLLALAFVCLAKAESFSFDRALQMYNDVNTAAQLFDYLKSASASEQKDYRYLLYTIRAYYAHGQFGQGDALVEDGWAATAKAGVSDVDTQQIRADLKKEREFWDRRSHYSEKAKRSRGGGKANSGGTSTTQETLKQR